MGRGDDHPSNKLTAGDKAYWEVNAPKRGVWYVLCFGWLDKHDQKQKNLDAYMKLICDFSKEQDKKKLFDALKMLKKEKYTVTIERPKKKRSINQNRYYWAVLGLISQETGNEADDLHDYFKTRFIPGSLVTFKETGEQSQVVGKSSALDTFDFGQYLDQIRAFAIQELNIYVMSPEEYLESDL